MAKTEKPKQRSLAEVREMPPRRQDRRIRKTKAALRRALTTLMAEKPIQEIRVRELAEMIDVNRGTFYRYYRDIYDMLAKLEDELFLQFEHLFDMRGIPQSIAEAKATMVDVLRLLANNSDLVLAFMGKNGDPKFVERIRLLVRKRILEDVFHFGNHEPSEAFEYAYAFAVNGCTGMIYRWLSTGAKEKPEELADILEKILVHGVLSSEPLEEDNFDDSW